MGFELEHVLADERHHGPFLCTICQNLCGLDALVTTTCSHVFCRLCLETWLNRPAQQPESAFEQLFGQPAELVSEKRCPTCNRDLSYQSHSHADGRTKSMMIGGENVDAHPLSKVQPLAYRVLRQVKVECPLHERHGCPWQGDYGDLQDHLVSATAHQNFTEKDEQRSVMLPAKRHKVDAENNDEGSADAEMMDTDDRKQSRTDMETESIAPDADESDSTRIQEEQAKRRSFASSFKEEANGKFSSGNFAEARDLYAKALSIMKASSSDTGLMNEGEYSNTADKELVAAIRANRAAAYLKLNDYQKCVDDCNAAIQLDSGYEKAYIRQFKALVELGKFEEAYATLSDGCANKPQSSVLTIALESAKIFRDGIALGTEQLESGDYAAAKATFGTLMLETSAIRVMLGVARADLGLGLTESAHRLSLQVIRRDSRSAEGYEVRGRCMYLMGDFENGMSLLREAVRLDPDCTGAKTALKQCRAVHRHIKDAREAVFSRKFERAVESFTIALDQCQPLPPKAPLNSKLYSERAEAYLRLKQYDAALKDCALAIYAQEDCVRAWLVKVKAYHALERHQEALDDLENLMRKWGAGDSAIRTAYEKADFEVRKQKRPDFYDLFGVPKVASEMEIKKAYKQKAKELHPDRLNDDKLTEEHRRESEEKFKLLGGGLEILCDDFKRQLYDEGYDQEAIRERVAAAQRAAHSRQRSYAHGQGLGGSGTWILE